ncbi:MAG TPA: MFS transporter, partial [Burkholderiales bacterium]|nr:MFS transporter [Burkholderiales bacterium]
MTGPEKGRGRLRLLVLMTALNSLAFGGMRFSVLLDAVRQDAPRLQIGLLGAMVSLFPMLLSLGVGRRIDLHGPRQPMMMACATLVACGAAGFIDHGMAVLFGMAIFAGIANNAWIIAHQQLVGTFSPPEELASSYSLSALGFSTAALAAPVCSGLSIEYLGFPLTYAWQAVIPLAALVVIGTRRLPLPEGSARKGSAVKPRRLLEVFDLLRSPLLREVYIVGAMFEASWTLFSFLTPLHGAQIGLSSAAIGMLTGCISITTLGVRVFLPYIVRRLPPWRMLILALTILGTGYFGFSLSSSVPFLVGFALLLGMGQAMG